MTRVVAAALLALAVRGGIELVYQTYFCPRNRHFEAVHSGSTQVVADPGERVARIGDSIFTCETDHHLGSFVMHRDLDCYCAPATMSLAEVSAAVNGTCTVDHLTPLRTDTAGSCRFARCDHYVR